MWDVFISHCSEDKPFARSLAGGLEKMGLSVWFDENILQIGDSIRESIDRGLANSEYGIVVLSEGFFKKPWPKNELNALFATEQRAGRILPVRHNLSIESLKRLSPLLADRFSIASNAGLKRVTSALAQTIVRKEGISQALDSPEGSSLIVLPLHALKGRALCIGQHPVTNAQYRKFIDSTGGNEPKGEHLVRIKLEGAAEKRSRQRDRAKWEGPFYPWRTPQFADPDMPVVCVSYADAVKYCRWANKLATSQSSKMFIALPTPALWEFAAYKKVHPPDWWIRESVVSAKYHHLAGSPAPTDKDRTKSNGFGVSDMIGNVWEWTRIVHIDHRDPQLHYVDEEPTVYGGGFLDDVRVVKLALESMYIQSFGNQTRHSDLGFRISASVNVSSLPASIQQRLNVAEQIRLLDFDTSLSDARIILQ